MKGDRWKMFVNVKVNEVSRFWFGGSVGTQAPASVAPAERGPTEAGIS